MKYFLKHPIQWLRCWRIKRRMKRNYKKLQEQLGMAIFDALQPALNELKSIINEEQHQDNTTR